MDASTSAAGELGCRTRRRPAPFSTPAIVTALVLFAAGFAGGVYRMATIPSADELDVVEYDLWTGLLAGVVGLALAASVLFVVSLRSVIGVGDHRATRRTVATWLGVVGASLGVIIGALVATSASAAPGIGTSLARGTRPITIITGICMLPGLATFLAIRWIAVNDEHWQEEARCRIHLVLRLRAELRRLLAALGAFLTLLVVTTGMRRRTLIAFDPTIDEPVEGVLLYGLVFALLLGAFYAVASNAIEARAGSMVDELSPMPDPMRDDFVTATARRDTLQELLGASSTWKSFETAVVIAAPLLTALIGTATGE